MRPAPRDPVFAKKNPLDFKIVKDGLGLAKEALLNQPEASPIPVLAILKSLAMLV